MAFSVNGNVLPNPSTHKWVKPPTYGTSGAGRTLYPGVLQYDMSWTMMSQAEYNLLLNSYVSGTTMVASLPEWQGLAVAPEPYEFRTYSGTYIDMPEYQSYFEGQYQGVRVLINNVTV